MEGPSDEYNAAADNVDALGQQLHALLWQVNQYELHVANALWVEKTLSDPATLPRHDSQVLWNGRGVSGGFPERLFPAARQEINAWVEKQTNDRITDSIPEGGVDSLTRLVLTNAIYFKGEWAETFLGGRDEEDDFLLAGGGKARVPMMCHEPRLGQLRGLQRRRHVL